MLNETKITIRGNLVEDPSLQFTGSGVAYSHFTVASTAVKYDPESGGWKDNDTLFLRCTAWRRLAENIAESLQRGMRVIVTGRLKQRSFEDREGHKRTVVEIDVEDAAPSLRNASVKVIKAQRQTGGQADSQIDPGPWDNAGGQERQPVPVGGFTDGQNFGGGAGGFGGFSNEPPF